MRWTAAGYPVVLGSRSSERAKAAARDIESGQGAPPVRGDDNLGAAQAGDIVVIAVPFSNHEAILDEIRDAVAGKIVVDAVVPLVPPKVSLVQLPAQGSAAQIAHERIGDTARVVSAFHNVGAAKLRAGGAIDCDVLVFGNDRAARDSVIALVEAIGTRGIDGGPIANSASAEALTSILIGINRRYKVDGAGIRITGNFGTSENT
jgi:NADPH-dependent F420 reductase